jgi:hypothetical protein
LHEPSSAALLFKVYGFSGPIKSRRVEKPFAINELVLRKKGIALIGFSMSLPPFFMNFRGPEAHGDRPKKAGLRYSALVN